jgi:hypothetical protein
VPKRLVSCRVISCCWPPGGRIRSAGDGGDEGQAGREAAGGEAGVANSGSQLFGGFLEGGDEPAVGFPEGFSCGFGEGVEERRG